MIKTTFSFSIALGTGLLLVLATPVSALTFLGASGFWSNPSPTNNRAIVYENNAPGTPGGNYLSPGIAAPGVPPLGAPNTLAPAGIRWGSPSPAGGSKSGLRSYGSTFAPGGVLIPTDGTITNVVETAYLDHINFPIASGTSIEQVNWNLTYNFLDDNNNPFSVLTVIPVAILETPNNPSSGVCAGNPPPGTRPPCPDRITLTQPNAAIVNIPGTTEFINLELLFPTTGTNVIFTAENQENFLRIDSRFSRVPSPAAFGGLGVLSLFVPNFKRLKKRYDYNLVDKG